MSTALPSTPAPHETRVWDPFVRIFHWSLVLAFSLAWLTGDEESRLHVWAGYAVLGLVAARLVWGFTGTRHARFRDFVVAPRTVLAYTRDLLAGHARRYLGHNPLGGVMILALLGSLTTTGVTGYLLEDGEGLRQATAAVAPIAPAQADDDDDEHERHGAGDEALEELHEFFANLTLLLVFLHVAGVLVGSLAHRENLVRAMFTGRKPV